MAQGPSPVGCSPLSPRVEDEADSLAHEVACSFELQNNASSDSSVPSKGSMDQSPVIVALDSKVSTAISERSTEPLTELSTNLPERSEPPKSKSGLRSPKKNRVRFADLPDEPSHGKSADTTEKSHHASSSRTTISTNQVPRKTSLRNSNENDRRLPRASTDIGERSRDCRPSSWYIPQKQTSESDVAPENRLEWFSDDGISLSHSGPHPPDPAPHAPKMKTIVNYRTHEAAASSPFPPMTRKESQHQDNHADTRPPGRKEPHSALVPWVGPGGSVENTAWDESASRYSKSRKQNDPDLNSSHLDSDRSSCRQLTTRMPPQAPSLPHRDTYPGGLPERQLSYRSNVALPIVSRPRSSTVPDGQLRSPQPDAQAMYIPPCPRSIPMETHDWHTITELTHVDICPGCAHQIGRSRFRNILIPSAPKPAGTRTRCAFSQPWVRLAWVQTIKLGLNHLELLYQVTRPTDEADGCSGGSTTVQTWYRTSDTETGRVFPDFNACSSCFRKLQVLIPGVRGSFVSQTMRQGRICDLWPSSPRLVRYIDLLDTAITRNLYDRDRYVDLREFIRYAKCKSKLDDCPRDHPILSSWHYIPDLPEFTICEDCYEDVVLPLSQLPIGNQVSCTLRPLPGSRPSGGETQQATCQLYSPRMRAIFRESVRQGDFSYLKAAALRRYDAEQDFRERKKRLLRDVSRGYDRDTDLRRNADQWKHSE